MYENYDITRMLREWSNGNGQALEDLMPLVYDELHRQAAGFLRGERPNHTLQTTDLIHETYLKLNRQHSAHFNDRKHFFAIAANMMRRILVDHARAKRRSKRAGYGADLPFADGNAAVEKERSTDLVALDEAMARLDVIGPRQVRVVELRYFSGLTLEETAEALGVSRATVATDWALAKAWLHRELTR